MSELDDYLRSRPDRCGFCGWAPREQGHAPTCNLAGDAPRKPTDPMTQARTGEQFSGPTLVGVPEPLPPEPEPEVIAIMVTGLSTDRADADANAAVIRDAVFKAQEERPW